MTLCFARPTVPVITKLPFGKSLDSYSYKLFFAKPPPTRRSYMSSPAAASPPDLGTADEPTSQSRTDSGSSDDVLVQYVVLRRDLIDTWPLGSVVTQGCHASVAAVWTHRDHAETLSYCSDSNLDHMHKVTLEVKGETQLKNLAEKLEAASIQHKLWIEQPENIPTCLATRPYPKSKVASFFKKLKLCK
ncbi:peptidyl-tRNA hydrolase II (PTH2) family protein [Carex rostrata]